MGESGDVSAPQFGLLLSHPYLAPSHSKVTNIALDPGSMPYKKANIASATTASMPAAP